MDKKTSKKTIGVCEIAELVGLHRNTISNWRKRNKMPDYIDGGDKRSRYTWNRERIMKWAKEKGLI